MTENEISKVILDLAIEVHRELGAGLLESVNQVVLTDQLRQYGLRSDRQDS